MEQEANGLIPVLPEDRFIIVALTQPMRIDDWPADKVPPLSPSGHVAATESVPRFMYWGGKEWNFDFESAHVYPWVKSAAYWSNKLATKAVKSWPFITGVRLAKLEPDGMEVHTAPADADPVIPAAGESVEISKGAEKAVSEQGDAIEGP